MFNVESTDFGWINNKFCQITSNKSLEIVRNLLTIIMNLADLSAGLKGNAVKMKRKETWGRKEDGEKSPPQSFNGSWGW